MKFRIVYTKKALDDIDGIYNYISEVLNEPAIAKKLIKAILQSIRTLEENPNRHHLCDEEELRAQNIRLMPVKNYLVAYMPDTENKTVNIIRVFYGRRDISKQLNDTE